MVVVLVPEHVLETTPAVAGLEAFDEPRLFEDSVRYKVARDTLGSVLRQISSSSSAVKWSWLSSAARTISARWFVHRNPLFRR